jgi:mRNA interferase HigB
VSSTASVLNGGLALITCVLPTSFSVGQTGVPSGVAAIFGQNGEACVTLPTIRRRFCASPILGLYCSMRVIALRTLKRFLESNTEFADAREPTLAWYQQVRKADWATPADVKRDIGNASILKDGRAVFNVAGNKYRIVVWINYPYRIAYIRFIGTHRQYDRIDAQTI